jgi:hypothetical protein
MRHTIPALVVVAVFGVASCDDAVTYPAGFLGMDTTVPDVHTGDVPTETEDTSEHSDVDTADAEDADALRDTSDSGDARAGVEHCSDAIDNDEDGDVDCDDFDCATHAECVLPILRETQCTNDIDDDSDGDVDCDDSDCASHLACNPCDEGLVRRGGECVGVFDADAVGAFPGTLSFVRDLQIPLNGTDAECCFDLNGDGVIDNGLSMLVGALGVLGGEVDIEGSISDALENDELTLVFEWGRGSWGNGFWAYVSTNDLDGDGEPDQDWATREAGNGIFRIQPEAIDAYGSIVQFNTVTDSGSAFSTEASTFLLHLPLAGSTTELKISQAAVRGRYTTESTGRHSVDEEFRVDDESIAYGGWELGGVIPLDDIGALLNDIASTCTCAGIDPGRPVVSYGDDGTQYNLACVQTVTGTCGAEDGVICENIATVCSFLPSLPNLGLNDIDTNGNGVGDALSVGFRISAVGATFDDCVVDDGC